MSHATTAAVSALPDAYGTLARSWRRSLAAANRSPATIRMYQEAVLGLYRHLVAAGMPTEPAHLTREHVESYLQAILEAQKPATALARHKALRLWFAWLVDEGELRDSPMARMKPPSVPETPPAILDPDAVRRLLKTCAGTDYVSRRDLAILQLLYDTGMRRGECAGLLCGDVDLDRQVARVTGKGSRVRYCPFGKRTALILDRYERMRAKHPHAHSAVYWLGHVGPMTDEGIYEVVKRRWAQAGLPGAFPHQFRHTYAHEYLVSGGQEGDLMQLAGWRSRQMLGRYGASAAADRAIAAYRDRSPGDRL